MTELGLSHLHNLQQLKKLHLPYSTQLASVHPLTSLASLENLSLSGSQQLKNSSEVLQVLWQLPHLKYVNLSCMVWKDEEVEVVSKELCARKIDFSN